MGATRGFIHLPLEPAEGHLFHDLLVMGSIPLEMLVPCRFVPDLETLEHPSKQHFLIQSRPLPQEGRNQNPPLIVKQTFFGTGNEMPHEGALIRLDQRKILHLGLNVFPYFRWICCQALIRHGNDQGIGKVLLQDLAKLRGNPQTPFSVQAIERLSSEERPLQNSHFSPLIPTFSHMRPLISIFRRLSNTIAGLNEIFSRLSHASIDFRFITGRSHAVSEAERRADENFSFGGLISSVPP